MSYDREEAVNNAVSNIMREVNVLGFPADDIAKKMACQHRTLQQAFMKLSVAFIKQLAQAQMWDARNEQAVRFAKEVVEKVDPDTMLMPCI